MKCWHCEAQNTRDSSTCWACGIKLNRAARRAPSFRPEAMRHYSSASVAVERHRSWLDGLVLLSTVLFGVLLGHFVANVHAEQHRREQHETIQPAAVPL